MTVVLFLSSPALAAGEVQAAARPAADAPDALVPGGGDANAGPEDAAAAGQANSQAGRPSGVRGRSRTSEWQVGVGIARSVPVYNARPDIVYGIHTVSFARELSGDRGPGPLRGRLAIGVEWVPALVELSPTPLYGAGVSPILARWHFVPHRRWSAFTEVAGGLLGTTRALPDGTAKFNFSAHGMAAVRVGVAARAAVVIGYRFEHISNGDRLETNPGINSHGLVIGWSVFTRSAVSARALGGDRPSAARRGTATGG